jgi:phosphate transport system substrate-binding protein
MTLNPFLLFCSSPLWKIIFTIILLCPSHALWANTNIEVSDLPLYKKSTDLPFGRLNFMGSESMGPLMLKWVESFTNKKMYPQVSVQLQSQDSAQVFEKLLQTPEQILATISRELTAEELNAFRTTHGYEPTPIRVAVDAIAIYANQKNPVRSISLEQLNKIFTHNDLAQPLHWGDIGVIGEFAGMKINPLSRQKTSGTRHLFDHKVLGGDNESPLVQVYTNPWDLLDQIATDPQAIGYGGMVAMELPGVKVVPIALDGKSPMLPMPSNCLSEEYPLSRSLYIYIGSKPGEITSTVQQEFFRYILSHQGQIEVSRQGMFPLQPAMAAKMLRRVQGYGLIDE